MHDRIVDFLQMESREKSASVIVYAVFCALIQYKAWLGPGQINICIFIIKILIIFFNFSLRSIIM